MTGTVTPSTASGSAMNEVLDIIDVDIHERPNSSAELVPYLDDKFRRYLVECNWTPERHRPHSQLTVGGVNRADAIPSDGTPAGSDLSLMTHQVLDAYDETYAVLTGWVNYNASAMSPAWPEFKTALMSAYNDWQIAAFLEKDSRLLGSIHVNAHDPAGAVREIERLAEHPRMVQVMIYMGDVAFGEPYYHPIYETAQRHGLVVAFHHGANSPTALGYHRYYVEWHTLAPQVFMSELVSLIFNGVFDKYPDLKVLMVEGGFTYVPHLMWRMDQNYRQLRIEVPWLKREPSRIIREQVRFATQPIEELTAEQLLQVIDQMGSDKLLCFSSDYPHWDFDSAFEALPDRIPADLRRRIMSENARSLYRSLAPRQDRAGVRAGGIQIGGEAP